MISSEINPAQIERNPHETFWGDTLKFLWQNGRDFDFIHVSPPCQAYSQGTRSIPDRLTRYPNLIGVVRCILDELGVPYVIENVAGAVPELINPVLLCGAQFNLTAQDKDGELLTLHRHRYFESSLPLLAPKHYPHPRARRNAGAYGMGNSRKDTKKGGYMPPVEILNELFGIDWMNQLGLKQAIPPVYTEFLGRQVLKLLEGN